MPQNIDRLNVFVGSPSDCDPERRTVRCLIPDVNTDLDTLRIPIEFKVVSWEDGVFPDIGRPQDIINQKLDVADIVLLVFWHKFGTDAGRGLTGTEEEFFRALERRHREGAPRVLLYFKHAPLPYHDLDTDHFRRLREFRSGLFTRRILLAGAFEREEEFRRKVRQALLDEATRSQHRRSANGTSRVLEAPSGAAAWSQTRSGALKEHGFASTQEVFGNDTLPGRVFSIELLTRPQKLLHRDGRRVVVVDRGQVSDAIFAGPARARLGELCLDTPDMRQWALRSDREIHDFLRGKPSSDLELPLEKCPLRWSSGGVFPVVEYRERSWVSFFFRDIWPEGWNLPLGASEITDSLNDPWSWLWREFLEELLVLRSAPQEGTEQALEWRKPVFAKNPDLQRPARHADAFSAEHIALRQQCDGMKLRASKDRPLQLDTHPTGTTLEIHQDETELRFPNVFFVAVNVCELGIEVVAPVSYSLDDTDYQLDGEILKPEDGERELVRMPVALISLEYLKRSFGDLERPLEFHENHASVVGAALEAEDIVVFDWDVRRRRAIANETVHGRGTESERYRRWRTVFDPAFAQALEHGRFSKELRTFTATSAKIASYYVS